MFCLGQGIFWIVVGSKQFESVVKDKIQIAKLFLRMTQMSHSGYHSAKNEDTSDK